MATVSSEPVSLTATMVAGLLGPIPLERIRFTPFPATEQDAEELYDTEERLFEVFDGMLVEKPMGAPESNVGQLLSTYLRMFLFQNSLGTLFGPDGFIRLPSGLRRAPDVAFYSWEQFPGKKIPATPVPRLTPDLAVEVLSYSNTPQEMAIKRADYFEAGTQLVWEVDPAARTVTVYQPNMEPQTLAEADTLFGEPLLPGFALPVQVIFAELE
ncbi:MAG: Uma2 family endonuclease [Gemmataceae bacterium]